MNEPLINHPDRRFQVWAYTVSHSQLLLWSTRSVESDTEKFSTRIEVLFKPVDAMYLPSTVLQGLVVTLAGPEMSARITRETGIFPDGHAKFFEIKSGGRRGFVVASIVAEDEAEREYYEPSKYGVGSTALDFPEIRPTQPPRHRGSERAE